MSILSTYLSKSVCLTLCLGAFVVIFGVGVVLVKVMFVQNVLSKAATIWLLPTYRLPGAFPCHNVAPHTLVNLSCSLWSAGDLGWNEDCKKTRKLLRQSVFWKSKGKQDMKGFQSSLKEENAQASSKVSHVPTGLFLHLKLWLSTAQQHRHYTLNNKKDQESCLLFVWPETVKVFPEFLYPSVATPLFSNFILSGFLELHHSQLIDPPTRISRHRKMLLGKYLRTTSAHESIYTTLLKDPDPTSQVWETVSKNVAKNQISKVVSLILRTQEDF